MYINKLGRKLTYALRHNPSSLNLELDEYGYANIPEVLSSLKINMEILEAIVAEDSKKRFTINDMQTKIRAAQGHSININLELVPIKPHKILYHGTATKFLDNIFKNGLIPMSRQHVHLSNDIETSLKVGQRHGIPAVLSVDAEKMHEDSFEFYLSENNIWLTKSVPVEFLRVVSKNN